MKINKLNSFTIFILFVLLSFKTIDHNNITIYQNGKSIEVAPGTSKIEISKDKFSIRFFNIAYNSSRDEFYSAQIAASLDSSKWEQISVGMSTDNISCFQPGTGMAASPDKIYESLIINNLGHHYVYYEDEKHNRANLLGKDGELLHLEFPVNKLLTDGNSVTMKKTQISTLYLAILIDRNLNKIVDEGELTKLIMNLKP